MKLEDGSVATFEVETTEDGQRSTLVSVEPAKATKPDASKKEKEPVETDEKSEK